MDLHRAPHCPGPEATTLICAGEVDSLVWQDFRQEIVDCGAGLGIRIVILDLAGVTFFDSSAVRAVIGARQDLLEVGVSLYIDRASPMVSRVLRVTGLDEFVSPSDYSDEVRGPAAAS